MTEGTQRIEALSDGVFAIAITLLVLEIRLQHAGVEGSLWTGLVALWPYYVAFALSFFVILVTWIAHHDLMRLVRATSRPVQLANGCALAYVTFIPFPTSVLAAHLGGSEANTAVAFYCGTFVLGSGAFNLLVATIARGQLFRPEVDAQTIGRVRRGYRITFMIYFAATGDRVSILGWCSRGRCAVRSRLRAVVPASALASAIAGLTASTALAEEKQFVVTGGVNFASFAGDAEEAGESIAAELEFFLPGTSWGASTKSRTGFDLGGEVVVPLGTAIALQPGLHYSQRGGKWKFSENTGTGFSADGTVKMNYLEFPVLLRISPPADSKVKVYFNLGPVLDIRLSSTFNIETSNGSEGSDDLDDVTNSVNFGAQGGVGLDIGVGTSSSVVVQARYHLGFTNVFDDETFSIRHSDAQLSAGFAQRFGGP